MTLTPKQEAFCRAYVETGCASKAYRMAYRPSRMKDKSIHEQSSKMLAMPKIASRVAELQRPAAEKASITLERLTNMALEAYAMAKEQANTSSMTRAVQTLAKLHGLGLERQRIEIDARNMGLDDAIKVLQQLGIEPELNRGRQH